MNSQNDWMKDVKFAEKVKRKMEIKKEWISPDSLNTFLW